MRELQVVKRSGRRVPFDRDKLMRSVQIALASVHIGYQAYWIGRVVYTMG